MSEPTFANGQRVTIVGRLGTVRFCGNTQFAPGVWVGVELDEAVGKNSGTVKDVEYFRCPPERGIFVRPPMVQVLDGEAASPQGADSKSRPSTASGEATSPKGEATSPKGEATSPKGADSKSRPSTASGEATSPKGADSKSRPTASGEATSPKGADSKSRPSTASGEAASPKGADSKSRPSTASGEATSPKGADTKSRPTASGEATSPKGADSKSRPSTASGATGEATSPKGADSKSRPSTASGATGKAASPKGADSKPRPSAASGEAASPKGPFAKPSRPSTASGSDGARREAKEKTETKEVPKKGEDKTENKTGAQKAATETSQGAEPAVEKVEEDKAAREKAAEKAAKAAAEKAPAEKAVAQKAAAEKAAAEKATAEKAAAEKAATEKAAAEKAAAEKGAAEKAAAEKAAAEKAAAEKVAAEKAAAEKAAEKAQKAAAEKVAAEKVAAEKEAAEKAAAERAAAEKAAAEKAAAEKAAAEKAAAEKAAAEKAAAEKAAAEKAAAEKAAAEKAAEKAAAEKAAAEKVLQAAETKRAEAAEKLRVMTMIRSKLKKKVENVQDQSQLQAALQEKLDASILARLMAEERLEELKLELAEAELKRDEEAEEKAKFLVQMVNIPTPQPKGEATAPPSEDGAMAALLKLQNRKKKEDAPAPPPPPPPAPEAPRPNITRSPELDAYQEALRVLHQASQQEVDEMQKQIAILDQDSNKVPRLKTDLKTLNNRQNLLQERMADVEMEAIELEQAAKAGDELRDLRDSVVLELRQEVEQREERLQQLEDLVLKLDKERRRLQEEADRDALDAKDLMEEVMKLSNGDTQARDQAGTHEVHGRLATASVQLRLARLDLATVKAKGAAFADCVPRTWQETTEAPSSASQSLSAALAIGACARAAERLLFRLEALGRHAAASGQRGAKLRMEMCEVACVAIRCAAAVASVLDAGLVGENTSIEATKKLEAQFKRVEQKTKELMHKKWPLDSPSQALNCLQEVETLTSEVLKGGLSVRGLCYQFQRFQVAFAYGVASKRATKHAVEAPPSEAAKPVQEEKVEEDGAMAALMRLQNRKKTPEEAPPEGPVEAPVAPAPVEQPQVELQPEDFQEDLWPEMELRLQVAQQTGGQHRAAESELQRLGKGIEVGLGKCATGEEEEPISFWRALKAASDYCQALLPPSETRIDLLSKNAEESLSRSSARLASEPPAWAASSLEVQSRVEEINEKHREVQEAQEQLKEKKKLLSFSEEEMLKAEDRGKKLKAKLSAMIEAQQTSDALQAEEEQLRRDVAAKAQRQAQLVQQIEETKAKRDKLEQLYKDEEKKRKHLEESIDKMRQRPKQDEDGRATAPEFAALRLSQQKGARELYALQVSGMNDLVPLPESKEVSSAEECVQKYTTLRKSLLRHLSSARVQRLGVRNPEEEVFASRLQELHFQLSEARSSLNALGPLSPQAKTLEAKPGGEAAEALTMAFTLQPPRWAHMKVPKELYSSSWSDIREIHVAAA